MFGVASPLQEASLEVSIALAPSSASDCSSSSVTPRRVQRQKVTFSRSVFEICNGAGERLGPCFGGVETQG